MVRDLAIRDFETACARLQMELQIPDKMRLLDTSTVKRQDTLIAADIVHGRHILHRVLMTTVRKAFQSTADMIWPMVSKQTWRTSSAD